MNKKKASFLKMQSIKTKLIVVLCSILALTILGCWLANQLFLPMYYQHSKISTLSDSFRKIDNIVKNDNAFQKGAGQNGLSEKSINTLDSLTENGSMNTYLFRISDYFGILQYTFCYPSADSLSNIQKENVRDKTMDYVVGLVNGYVERDGRELIKGNTSYQVFKSYDERIGSYYLELFGRIDSGDFVYMSTNYQSMKESVAVSNRFLAYIGVIAVLISGILLFMIGNNFTKPIVYLTDIATRMSQLDFEAKYESKVGNEIDVLGDNFNRMSSQLETTISELKSANNELQRDIEDKIKIDKMRKEFLDNVSHELKTPIALIQGYAEGLKENISDDPESREFYCDVIMDEASKMNKLVKNLLTLNQLESGKDAVVMERFDIVSLIRGVLQTMNIMIGQKEANVIFEAEKPVYVWADEFKIEEVVTNYVSNALNHLDGEKEIEIKLQDEDNRVKISVFNTGTPIPEADVPNLWNKFYKVDKARTREYGGSGIGLSIVKAIMESMNQEYGVQNFDNGVEFWFTLDRK